ncbi:proline-rich protein 2-like [Perca fluviatilis]|uniref:proline-rich protein 2-like n=1 Tax=Perca fluviatilis TaxID=8168 RepID=UPI0019669379|nr:proline-rich protein 2-like [Perca fluviatilis]
MTNPRPGHPGLGGRPIVTSSKAPFGNQPTGRVNKQHALVDAIIPGPAAPPREYGDWLRSPLPSLFRLVDNVPGRRRVRRAYSSCLCDGHTPAAAGVPKPESNWEHSRGHPTTWHGPLGPAPAVPLADISETDSDGRAPRRPISVRRPPKGGVGQDRGDDGKAGGPPEIPYPSRSPTTGGGTNRGDHGRGPRTPLPSVEALRNPRPPPSHIRPAPPERDVESDRGEDGKVGVTTRPHTRPALPHSGARRNGQGGPREQPADATTVIRGLRPPPRPPISERTGGKTGRLASPRGPMPARRPHTGGRRHGQGGPREQPAEATIVRRGKRHPRPPPSHIRPAPPERDAEPDRGEDGKLASPRGPIPARRPQRGTPERTGGATGTAGGYHAFPLRPRLLDCTRG